VTAFLRSRMTRPWPRRTRPLAEPRAICDDLASWADRWPGAERRVLDPGLTVTRPMPRSLAADGGEGFAELGTTEVPERALVKIPGARLCGEVGLVVLPSDELVGELVALTPAGRRQVLEQAPEYRDPLPARPTRRRGDHYAFLGSGQHHYYHWTHDLVMGARGLAEVLPPDARLIVPAAMRPWQHETLATLGLDDHRQVPFGPDDCWELENLYVVTPRLKTQIDSPEPFRWFRTAVMDRFGITEAAPSRRLYLTRRHDNHWRTVNEPEVEALLARYGFETVAPGELAFRAQVELFGEAEVIVGTGAGLFNMVFSPPGTKVLQFQERVHMVNALWTEACAMGFEYHYVLGDTVPNPEAHDLDIHMPLDRLEASLQAMGLAPRGGARTAGPRS